MVVLKIGDFGLARFINQSSQRSTKEMTTCGTLDYASKFSNYRKICIGLDQW